MKVGCLISAKHPFENCRTAATLAEREGFDSVWMPDHFLGLNHPALWPDMALGSVQSDPDAWYDPFAAIAAVGPDLNLPIGVCVPDAIRRRAPDIARTALTLHQICRAGFRLGVGSGEAENLLPFGYDFSTPVAELESFLAELRSLLDHGVPRSGSCGRIGLPLSRDDVGPPKIWVGGQGPRLLRLTGEYGDGWLPAWPMSPGEYGDKCRTIAGHAERTGRPMPERGMLIGVMVGESRDHVAELMDRDPLAKLSALNNSAELWAKYGLRHPAGDNCRGIVDLIPHELDPAHLRALAPQIPVELVEESLFIGSSDDIIGRISGYADHGLGYAVLSNQTGVAGGLAHRHANAEGFSAVVAAVSSM